MDAERALVSKIAHLGRGASELLVEGYRADFFVHDDCREVWELIISHQHKYGKQPTVPTIIEQCPHFNFELTEEPLDYVKERFIHGVERREAIEFARSLAVACNEPEFAGKLSSLMLEKGRELTTMLPGSKVHRFSDAQRRIEEYEERVRSGRTMTGIPMGIPPLDEATLGIQPHEMVSIVGWQGTGKSTLAQWILGNFYLQGKRPLYISLEMTADALMRKWDQMFQQFTSYRHLKMLALPDDQVKKWREWAKDAKKRAAERDIIVLADGGAWTVDRVHAEILKHGPDAVAIDYLSLMESGDPAKERWVNLTVLTRALKQIALQTTTPIFAISQTNRESAKAGAQMDNIGGSYSVGADSDIVIGLHQDDEMRAWKEMEIRLIKNRDGEMVDTRIYWDMEHMRFNDSFAMEQMRKTREGSELAVAEGIVNTETGEITPYTIGAAAATAASGQEA